MYVIPLVGLALLLLWMFLDAPRGRHRGGYGTSRKGHRNDTYGGGDTSSGWSGGWAGGGGCDSGGGGGDGGGGC